VNDGLRKTVEPHGEELEELAAGYALEALDADDAARFQAHLDGCDRCRDLVAELRAAAAVLPEALRPIAPSPTLRDRLLAEALRAPNEAAMPARAAPAPLDERRATGLGTRSGLWALSLAALFAVTLGFGYWNFRLQQQVTRQAVALDSQALVLQAVAAGGRQWTLNGTADAPGAAGVLVQDPADPRPLLMVRDLPPLGQQQAYQAWVIAGSAPLEAGLLERVTGAAYIARLERPLDSADTVAVTVEPAGGSRAPTGPIVVAGRL